MEILLDYIPELALLVAFLTFSRWQAKQRKEERESEREERAAERRATIEEMTQLKKAFSTSMSMPALPDRRSSADGSGAYDARAEMPSALERVFLKLEEHDRTMAMLIDRVNRLDESHRKLMSELHSLVTSLTRLETELTWVKDLAKKRRPSPARGTSKPPGSK